MKKQSLISAFDSILGPPVESAIPEGFFSIEAIAKRQSRSCVTIGARLAKLSASGKVERRRFRNENGRACWFYRVK